MSVDILVIGAGPSGSAATMAAAARGLEVLLVDQATFPRDKTCGDGLTPRAMHALRELGVDAGVGGGYRNRGLKLHGFGGSVTCPWPESSFGTSGSAMRRTELDAHLLQEASSRPGVRVRTGVRATTAHFSGPRLEAVSLVDEQGVESLVRVGHVIVADGVRSTFGKTLGRQWHKSHVYGIAARAYCSTERGGEEWIHSHLELKDPSGVTHPGYGWVFPLGDGVANVGCGALSTQKRPSRMNTKKVLAHYADSLRAEWGFGQPTQVASALLPMGGAVSGVAGRNWVLIGDAAACVNPLNGEGIDYGLETAQLAVGLIAAHPSTDLSQLWPQLLREQYGDAFGLARFLAQLLTLPRFLPLAGPVALRGPQARVIMPTAARLMGNLVTDEDRDVVARLWRAAGGVAGRQRQLWD